MGLKKAIGVTALALLFLAGLAGVWLVGRPTNPTVPPAGAQLPPAQGGVAPTSPAPGGGQVEAPGGTTPAPVGAPGGSAPGDNGNGTPKEKCKAGWGGSNEPPKWGLHSPRHRDHASPKGEFERLAIHGGHGKGHHCHKAKAHHAPPFMGLALPSGEARGMEDLWLLLARW